MSECQLFKILLVKETRANERRVALLPGEVKQLVNLGHTVFVESGAGVGVGYSDAAYEEAGATIRSSVKTSCSAATQWRELFHGVNVVVRAKRPDPHREPQEIAAMESGAILIGALDPFEPGRQHVQKYYDKGIKAYSVDQLNNVKADNPLNILAAMSTMTGRLAFEDALKRRDKETNKAVIIGFGTAGRAAFTSARQHGVSANAFYTRNSQKEIIESQGGLPIYFPKDQQLESMVEQVREQIHDADVVIAAARSPGEKAPILISEDTLNTLQPGTIVVDLTIAEGGNVAGSAHDKIITRENDVQVVNISGYPKVAPLEASEHWSRGSCAFIRTLAEDPKSVQECEITSF
eukprot:gb/GECG01007920.1/.p1 GENE.gb/GECG01007920.1/~~gb/GECG01007920.1/.p1  ORF type:complete len:350 (+),score=38.89 gb/GECG01007920.1/:1-1050(+)